MDRYYFFEPATETEYDLIVVGLEVDIHNNYPVKISEGDILNPDNPDDPPEPESNSSYKYDQGLKFDLSKLYSE